MKNKLLTGVFLISILYIGTKLLIGFDSYYVNTDLNKNPYDGYEMNHDGIYDPIVHLGNENGAYYCSGFIINKYYAITAAHCVTGSKGLFYDDTIMVTSHGDEYTTKSKIVGYNTRLDTAIITGDFSKFHFMPIQYRNIKLTNGTYLMCGFPLGVSRLNCNPSLITGKFGFSYAMSGLVFPGHSGGPVIDSESMEVIGINSAAYGQMTLIAPTFGIIDNFGIGK